MSLKNNFARLLLLLTLLSTTFLCADDTRAQENSFGGRWEMEAAPVGDTLSVMLGRATEGGSDKRYFKLALAELSGLTRGEVFARGGRVRFQLRRPAGTFDFTGEFKEGRGAGTFTFAADTGYIEKMEREGQGEAVRKNLFGFAIGNYGDSPADDFAALGIERPTAEQLKEMIWFGVTVEFVRELKSLGYEPRSVDQLIAMRRHGASLAFINELKSLGYERPTLDQLIDMRKHGASIDFIKGLEERGYERPALDQLIEMRVHGASLAFIDELKSLGYERVPVEQLVGMRKHGVTTRFIRELQSQGITSASPRALIDVKMFGMPVEHLRHLPTRDESEKADGDWRAKFYRRGTDKVWVYLHDRTGRIESRSFEVAPEQFVGMTEAQAFSAGGAEVRFTLRRGDSTIVCTGWFKDGFGAGVFTHVTDAKRAATR